MLSVARRLEFNEAEIQGFNHANNGKGLADKSYRILCWWLEKSYLSGENYQVLYKALCHKYVDRKDLAGLFCIRESSNESEKKKEDSTPE